MTHLTANLTHMFFRSEFEEVSICTLGPDFNADGTVDGAKSVKVIFGEWKRGRTAGGSRNNMRLFAKNPQFLLVVHEADQHDDEEGDAKDPKCEFLITLAQEYRRSRRDQKAKLLQIGYCLYRHPDADSSRPLRRLEEDFFMYNYDAGSSGPYINYREVFKRFDLSPGAYVIVPATFEPDCSSRFMIRVYSTKAFTLKALRSNSGDP